ncbi:hypothetical protein THAOC_09274 [Thalassiosira oceanica]|uniref:Calpain catalytic domain-containing protein n=1 Tax=Thalassiosira oceanica TaxID=159749 RepID=K0SSX4_THAOC|nr:hypothetical protein THAOC_09274 [Thalassiosira oceanica]|eukprot:EJK69468.1 hypothetical protein THAOC_09274 [Thalassiosira oceanica]
MITDLLFDEPSVEKIELRAHPPSREPPLPPDDTPAVAAADGDWTPRDTSDSLAGLEYEVHLGLRLYKKKPARADQRGVQPGGQGVRRPRVLRPGGFAPPRRREEVRARDHIAAEHRRLRHVGRAQAGREDKAFHGQSEGPRRGRPRGGGLSPMDLEAGFVDARPPALRVGPFPGSIRRAFDLEDDDGQTTAESGQGRYGAYVIRIYPEGQRRYLLMDDYLLCLAGGCDSPSLHSLDEKDLWIRILEKAFVKLQSSYASLDGYYKFNSLWRHPARAMQLVTGVALAMEVHLPDDEGVDGVYAALAKTEGRFARVAHGRKRINGLYSGHGYSLLWVGEISGVKLACLRNPHGTRSYVGKYGRGERSFDSDCARKVRDELLVGTGGGKGYISDLLSLNESGDNGAFLIEFEVFMECFPIVTLIGPVGKVEPDLALLTTREETKSTHVASSRADVWVCTLLKATTVFMHGPACAPNNSCSRGYIADRPERSHQLGLQLTPPRMSDAVFEVRGRQRRRQERRLTPLQRTTDRGWTGPPGTPAGNVTRYTALGSLD